MAVELKTRWMELWKVVKAQKVEVVIMVALVFALSLGISLLFPLQYSAKARLLVVLENELNLDSFAASRSAERIAYNLSRIIKSDSFLERVRSTSYKIGSDFPQDLVKRRKYWSRKVDADVMPGTAIIEIKAFDRDTVTARSTVEAISEVLALQGSVYHGGGDKVRIQLIDFPWISRFPVRPNLIVNGILGLIVGIILSFIYEGLRFRRIISQGISDYKPPVSQQVLSGNARNVENLGAYNAPKYTPRYR